MNGLKTIRRQCNFSLSELANTFGVTRQAISAWENGKKPIPKQRREQIAEFFGIEEKYLEEITVKQREEIINKTMYRFSSDWRDKYRYRPIDSTKVNTEYHFEERKISEDRELEEVLRDFKCLEKRLSVLKERRKNMSEEVWIDFIKCNNCVLTRIATILENVVVSDKQALIEQYELINVELLRLEQKLTEMNN